MASPFPDIHFLPIRVLLLLSFLFFSCSQANGSFEGNEDLEMVTQTAPAELSHYVLALQWPNAVCSQGNWRCSRDLVVPNRFTILGLWPSYERGAPILNCNTSDIFDWNQVKSLDDYPHINLTTKWPNLSNRLTLEEFYRQEWIRHGTCSGLGQREYFERALKLYDLTDVLYRLGEIGVTPRGQQYTSNNVVTQYEDRWNQTIQINCVRIASHQRFRVLLSEIGFRVDLKATTIESMTGLTNLCRSHFIEFPAGRLRSGFPKSAS